MSHTPAHSDACIAGLQESGRRAVYTYSPGLGPGTIVVTPDATPLSMTAAARQWLDHLGRMQATATICGLVAKAGSDAHESAWVRMRTRGGHWVALHAARLSVLGFATSPA